MGLSRLAAKCQVCPFVATCDHKEMEAVAFLHYLEAGNRIAAPGSGGSVKIGGKIDIDTDKLVRTISEKIQLEKIRIFKKIALT